jgi:hypothetical protein
MVLTNGFKKKDQKVLKSEINLAISRKKGYLKCIQKIFYWGFIIKPIEVYLFHKWNVIIDVNLYVGSYTESIWQLAEKRGI